MSSTLVLPPSADSAPPGDGRDHAAALAAGWATAFVRGQAAWLQRAVDRGHDDMVVELVLQAHDRSHERWVSVIAHVQGAIGGDAADAVAKLYAYFGRVAGSLDARSLQLLDADVAAQVRALVSARLDDVTEHTVDAVWGLAAQI